MSIKAERNEKPVEPDNTAVRTALWRALHMVADTKPHILEDNIGLKLIAPPGHWQQQPDMKFTRRLRASVVARSRFVEDLVTEQTKHDIRQYVILGAGLDTFAQRRQDIASDLRIYEIDQRDTLDWKQQRLIETGLDIPESRRTGKAGLHFVPVDFETDSWWEQLAKSGFDTREPAVVACTGVSLYLTKEAISAMLNQIAAFASGSTLAMTFYLPTELLDEEDKPMQEIAEKGAREAGTPFKSFFTPAEILDLAREAGFKESKTISTKDMQQRYFANRTDDLVPASGEVFLLATT